MSFGEIVQQLVDGLFVEWYQVFFVVFVEGVQYVFVEVDFMQFQIDQFGDVQFGGVDGFEYGVVVQVEWIVDVWCVEQVVDLFF